MINDVMRREEALGCFADAEEICKIIDSEINICKKLDETKKRAKTVLREKKAFLSAGSTFFLSVTLMCINLLLAFIVTIFTTKWMMLLAPLLTVLELIFLRFLYRSKVLSIYIKETKLIVDDVKTDLEEIYSDLLLNKDAYDDLAAFIPQNCRHYGALGIMTEAIKREYRATKEGAVAFYEERYNAIKALNTDAAKAFMEDMEKSEQVEAERLQFLQNIAIRSEVKS